MFNKDTLYDIFICVAIACLVAFVLYAVYYFTYVIDKQSCYEQAELYETEVIKYSFFKKYCFVEMDGKKVNLDKYRVVNN